MIVKEVFNNSVKIIDLNALNDIRGSFVKIFSKEGFTSICRNLVIEEIFYSTSKKNVLRGFHFQTPPYELEKLVWVTEGRILDVLLDLRRSSSTYGKCFSVELSSDNKKIAYIPAGIGHSFLSFSDVSTVFYATTKIFSKEHDAGIRWNSVDFDWPIDNPIISEKDSKLPFFKNFKSPF